MSEEEQIIYDEIIKLITENKFLSINGTPMTLNEVNNYITNLQQENKHLKEQLEILLEDNSQLEEIRIKAIEYIKKHIEEWENDEDEYLNGVAAEDKDILQLIQELKEKYK